MTTSQVARVTPDTVSGVGEWVGAAEIAQMLGVSRQRVQQIVSRHDFPRPVIELRMGKIWATSEVRAWAKARGRNLDASS